jgi:hypothetical protein
MAMSAIRAVLLLLVCCAVTAASARHLLAADYVQPAEQRGVLLSKLSALLNALANTAIPTSIATWFALLVNVFPALARFQPAINRLSAPPGPPLLSTVDPTAFIYVP